MIEDVLPGVLERSGIIMQVKISGNTRPRECAKARYCFFVAPTFYACCYHHNPPLKLAASYS